MCTVTLLAQKGGVGKTTLALSLAVLASKNLRGPSRNLRPMVAFIDTDPSQNATEWLAARRARLGGTSDIPAASAVTPVTLSASIGAARDDGYDWIFIDTAAGTSSLPALAAEAADIVLIPALPTAGSMRGLAPSARLGERLGKLTYFVLNRASRSPAINRACAEALEHIYHLPTCPCSITSRALIGALEDQGKSLSEVKTSKNQRSTVAGQREFQSLFTWLSSQRAAQP
jgi:chromosome partitioning protein